MTVKQHPFVYVEDRPPTTGNCSDLNKKNKHYVQCTGQVFDSHDDHSKEHGVHCCSGIVCYSLLDPQRVLFSTERLF